MPLFPFFRGVFSLVLLTFRYDLSLLEHGNGWSDPFIEIFLIDFDPVGIVGLFANLDAFKDLLLVGFQCREVLWCEDIRRAVKTREFSKLTDQLGCFEAVS